MLPLLLLLLLLAPRNFLIVQACRLAARSPDVLLQLRFRPPLIRGGSAIGVQLVIAAEGADDNDAAAAIAGVIAAAAAEFVADALGLVVDSGCRSCCCDGVPALLLLLVLVVLVVVKLLLHGQM